MCKARIKNDFSISRSFLAGTQAVAANTVHVFAPHSHEEYGVGVILQGGHKSRSGRGIVEALTGDTITVNPGEVHDGTPIGGTARAWCMLYFNPSLVHDVARDLSDDKSDQYEFVHPAVSNPATASSFKRLYDAVTTGGNDDASTMLREQLLYCLLDRLRAPAAPLEEQSLSTAILRARTMIDDSPTAALSLAALAEASGLSRFQLVRQFARATGLTPHAYLVQRRIEIARGLIASGVALAEAAAASGFSDQSHMTRIFVRKYGISPGVYAAALT